MSKVNDIKISPLKNFLTKVNTENYLNTYGNYIN